jgi:hypothetical protein
MKRLKRLISTLAKPTMSTRSGEWKGLQCESFLMSEKGRWEV